MNEKYRQCIVNKPSNLDSTKHNDIFNKSQLHYVTLHLPLLSDIRK